MQKPIIISLIFLSVLLSRTSGQTHVQTTTLYQTTTATTISKVFAAASTTGNLIVVHIDWDNQARTITSVTDTKGNTYAAINGPTNWNGANFRAALWYAYNITGGGAAITVTAHLSGAPTSYSQIYISEYSGIASSIDPLDQNSVAASNTGAVSSGAKTTTYSNELVYGASIGSSGALSTGAGFTNRSTANQNIIEDKNVAVSGSDAATFTSAGGNWVAQMATFISTNSTLPVTLSTFSGQCNNGLTVLDWSTASETNNDYFSIQQSSDAVNWTAIGKVNGAGNSAIEHNYSYTIDAANNMASYFRISQTDFDGTSTWSNVILVNGCAMALSAVTLYPNPCNGTSVSIRTNLPSNETSTIQIFDDLGRIVSRSSQSQPEFSIYFPHPLPAGIYYIRISSPAGVSSVTPLLVKQ
jgi:hypothetical protein